VSPAGEDTVEGFESVLRDMRWDIYSDDGLVGSRFVDFSGRGIPGEDGHEIGAWVLEGDGVGLGERDIDEAVCEREDEPGVDNGLAVVLDAAALLEVAVGGRL
jgi:hypothetical protein